MMTLMTALCVAAPAGELEVALERLNNTARVLYVAAHPDDENTRLLAYLVNHRHVNAAYLSLTRGGGGQNLVGSEQSALLGVMRTQELLAARRIDGAEQRFTRARDFGYSKTAAETFANWDHDEILADVVWVIRRFRPDVIVTRFTEKPPNHGHHTASAILAREAFTAAADPKRFSAQLDRVQVWQAKRVVNNVPRWGRRGAKGLEGSVALNVGGYDPRLGVSYGEMAAQSRSMHKSQGFGSAGKRGEVLEYFKLVAGSPFKEDILDGVDTSWRRIKGATRVASALKSARAKHQSTKPELAVPSLLKAYDALGALQKKQNLPRIAEAKEATAETIAQSLGLFARVTSEAPQAMVKTSVKASLELIKRRPQRVQLVGAAWAHGAKAGVKTGPLADDVKKDMPLTVMAPKEPSVSYWLGAKPGGRYAVTDKDRIGEAEGPAARVLNLQFRSGRTTFELSRPLVYTWTDRVLGERTRRFVAVPAVTVTPPSDKEMFTAKERTLQWNLRASGNVKAKITVKAPGWKVKPAQQTLTLKAGEERLLEFSARPLAGAKPVDARPVVTVDGQSSSLRYDQLDHTHIPVQAILRPSSQRWVPLSLKPPRGLVGYVPGSGDTVAEDLRSVGLNVEEIDAETLRQGQLKRYQVIMLGVRAFNVRDDLKAAHPGLMKWVKAGGTLVVQYNTSNRWRKLTDPVGPYPFDIDRGRVTDETAKVTMIDPKHPVFQKPNRLTDADFEGWVQERGLYFAKTWDKRYQPLVRMQDPDEDAQEGALLTAQYGRGVFVYTGISFFRQLPAGVPGAYRLLANILSLGMR